MAGKWIDGVPVSVVGGAAMSSVEEEARFVAISVMAQPGGLPPDEVVSRAVKRLKRLTGRPSEVLRHELLERLKGAHERAYDLLRSAA